MPIVCRVLAIAVVAVAVATAEQSSGSTTPAPSGLTPAPVCADITKLDFRNLTITTAQRTFSFHDGIAINSDTPSAPGVEQPQPDWKAAIEKDSVVHPAPNVIVRFLLINDSHETGSGWRYYATGLRCSEGRLQEVFHRDGLSLSIDRLDSNTVRVGLNGKSGESARRQWSYAWDRKRSRYVITSEQ